MLHIAVLLTALWASPDAEPLSLIANAKPVPAGSTYYQPINTSSASVALFSEQRDLFTIRNTSDAELTIESITLEEAPGVLGEEFTLQDTENKPGVLQVQNVALAPDGTLSFYVRFYPVHSGVRTAEVTIRHSGGKEYKYVVSGKGRDNARFFAQARTSWQRIYGGAATDEQATALATDAQGNVYLVGQVTQVVDRFAYDLLIAKASPSGELLWSKLWAGPYRDYSRDTGQNDQTGGGADAVAVDTEGNLYVAGAVSRSKSNNDFAAFVMKVTPNGELAWEKLWRPEWPSSLLAKHGAQAYGLRTAGDRVYVTGSTGAARSGAESHVFVLALGQADGSLVWQKALDPHPGSNDRGYTVAIGQERIWIGGSANNRAFVACLEGLDDPQLAWFETIQAGTGSNVNSLDLDPDGNAYAAVDVRGMNCTFSLLKLDAQGQKLWGRTYTGGRANQNNNTHVVRCAGHDVVVGGRIAMEWMDGQMGDGFAMRVGQDGTLQWSTYYFTGKGPDEIQETRVKGFAIGEQSLVLFGQLYTGNMNGVRYHGYWYDGTGKLEPYSPSLSPLALKPEQYFTMEQGAVQDAAALAQERQWLDAPQQLVWQDPLQKADGSPPDEDWFLMRLDFEAQAKPGR